MMCYSRYNVIPRGGRGLPVLLPASMRFAKGNRSPLAASGAFVGAAYPYYKGPTEERTSAVSAFMSSS